MGKNYTQIFKILEHLGEGTISDIEKKVKDEDKIIEDIKADLGLEDESELDLDEILKDDLQALGGYSEKKEAEQELEKEISKSEPEASLDMSELEQEMVEQGTKDESEELDLGELALEEELKEVKKDVIEGKEETTEEVIEEKGTEEVELPVDLDLSDLEQEVVGEVSKEEATGEELDLGELALEEELKEEVKKDVIEEEEQEKTEESQEPLEEEIIEEKEEITEKPIEEVIEGKEETTEEVIEGKESEKSSLEGLEEFELGELETGEDIELSELDKLEEEIEKPGEEAIEEGLEVTSEKDEFIDLSELQEIAGIEEEGAKEEAEDITISDEDLEIIKNTLKNDYPVWLSKEIKNLILNDALAVNELQTLIDLIVSGTNYKEVEKYLEKTLNIKVRPQEVEEKIYVPSTYEIIFPYIKWATISIFTIFLLGVSIFYFVYIPYKAKSYYNLGYSYLEKNKIEQAQKYYNIALNYKISPKQILRYGKKYLELGYYKIAEEKIKYGIALRPEDLEFYFVLSDIYFAQKLYDKSIKLLENLYANVKFAKKPELYLEIGKKYEKLQQYQDAISTYIEGLRAVGANKDIYFRLLDDSIKTNNLVASKKVYIMIKNLSDKLIDDRIFTDYAALLLKHKKDFEAIDVMDRVKKHNKYYAPVYYYYGIYYVNRRKPDEALKNLKYAEQVINLGYSDKKFLDKIYNFIGEIYLNKGDKYYPESYNYFNKAIAENPNNPKPYYNLARIYYFYTNQFDIALKNLLTAERLGYTDDHAEYMKGWIYYNFGNYKNAIKRFIVLQQKYINNIYLKLAVGNTFIKLNKPELAIGFLESVISYWERQKKSIKFLNIENPDIAKIFVNLSVAYNNLGVAYQLLSEQTKNKKYSSYALQYFLKSEEEYSKSNKNFQVNSEAKINSLYILHPDIKRELLLMDSKDYFPNDIFPK